MLDCEFKTCFNSFSYAIPANSVVNTDLDVTMGYFNKDYTAFEVGLKLFFFSASATLWFAYSLILCTGPGTRDEETGQRLATSPDQAFCVVALSFLDAL
jgi:hypothetical protein